MNLTPNPHGLMKLTIIITGLVLLAPDRSNQRLHLFFPQMDMSHPKAEPHAPYLTYVAEDGPQNVPLAGWMLDLGTVARPGGAEALPPEIIDLRSVFSGGVDRDWVTGVPPGRIQARMSLPWPDAFKVDGTARWRLRRGLTLRRATLTNSVVLEYEMSDPPPTTWRLSSLPVLGETMDIPAFKPSGSRDTLRISNLSPHDSHLTLDEEGIHFQGYVDVLRRSFVDKLLPRPRLFLDQAPGLSPFNCMLASSEVRP